MTLVLITVMIGVFNICVGFALGVYVQNIRQASSGKAGVNADITLDDGFAPYRNLAKADGEAASGSAPQVQTGP